MGDFYELLLFLHITSAIIWLGAGFLLLVQITSAERGEDRARHLGFYREIGWLSPRLFIPASLSTFVFGVLLVIDGPWGFDQLWIQIGLIGYLASFFTGLLYFKPTGERVGELVQEHGPGHPEIDRRLRPMALVDRFQVLVLFTVVADMVFKPTGDDTGLLIAGAVILALGAVVTVTGLQRLRGAATVR